VRQTAPQNTVPPTIAGIPSLGQTLTVSPGTWTGDPAPTFTYQWVRCPASGGASDGSDCAVINTGTWTGSGITFAYAWQRCDATGAGCTPIPLATGSTYTLVTADSGRTIGVCVTATNTTGSNAAQSAQTAVVTAPSGTTGCPPGTGVIDVDRLAPPLRLQISRQQISPSPVTRSTQTIRVSFQITACSGRPVEGALVYATPTPNSSSRRQNSPRATTAGRS
jgi:hypothetical protein